MTRCLQEKGENQSTDGLVGGVQGGLVVLRSAQSAAVGLPARHSTECTGPNCGRAGEGAGLGSGLAGLLNHWPQLVLGVTFLINKTK